MIIDYRFLASTSGLLIGFKATSDLVGRIANLLLFVLAARTLVSQDFGILSLAILTGWLAAIASDWGLQIYLAREVAKRPREAYTMLLMLLRWRILLALILFGPVAVTVGLINPTGNPAPFLLIVLSQLEVALIDFVCHYFRGLERSQFESGINLLFRPLNLAGGALALWLFGSLLALSVAVFLVSGFALLMTLLLALRISRKQGLEGVPAPTSERKRLSDSIQELFPIGSGILLSGLYFRSDLYMIDWMKGLHAVASYNAVFRLIDALRLIPSAFLTVVFPRLCRGVERPEWQRFALWLALLGGLFALVLAGNAEFVVTLLYGPRFLSAVPAFKILLISLPFLYLNYLLTHQLIAWDLQSSFALFCGLGLIVNVAMNFALIPGLGIEGASWSTLATELLLTGAWIVLLFRHRVGSKASVAEE